LNTVLDDTRILCLSNGERIKLHENIRLIFETDTMAYVSPATISRCGILFLDEN
jgi:dynein heavy chain